MKIIETFLWKNRGKPPVRQEAEFSFHIAFELIITNLLLTMAQAQSVRLFVRLDRKSGLTTTQHLSGKLTTVEGTRRRTAVTTKTNESYLAHSSPCCCFSCFYSYCSPFHLTTPTDSPRANSSLHLVWPGSTQLSGQCRVPRKRRNARQRRGVPQSHEAWCEDKVCQRYRRRFARGRLGVPLSRSDHRTLDGGVAHSGARKSSQTAAPRGGRGASSPSRRSRARASGATLQ
jgi:hypothetical protein